MKHPIFHPDEKAKVGPYPHSGAMCGMDCDHVEQNPSKDQLAELKKYHAEIVEIDGAECEAMRLTRWAIEEIMRLRASTEPASAHIAKRRPAVEESDLTVSEERDWWRNYALDLERSAQPPRGQS